MYNPFYAFMLVLQEHYVFLSIVGGIIYLIGIIIDLDCTTTETESLSDKSLYFYNREKTPKDMWFAMSWPLRFFYSLFKGIVWVINCTIITPLALIIGIRYQRTRMHKIIDKWCFK